MDTRQLDRILIDPERGALREALLDTGALPPQMDLRSLLNRWQRAAEGSREWSNRTGTQTICVAWWSDALGRKHCRIVRNNGPLHGLFANFLYPEDPQRPALWLIYPERVFLRYCNGRRFLQVCCDCGVSGTPEAVGWMGQCCAACHDRNEEGRQAGSAATAVRTFRADGAVSAVAFAPKGRTLAVAAGNVVRLWDTRTGGTEDVPANLDGLRSFVAFVPRGGSLLFGTLGRRGPVQRRDPGTRRIHLFGDYDLRGVSLSAAGRVLALATPDQVEILDTSLWRPLHTIYGHVRAITCAALSPDGRTLATGSEDRTAVLWDVQRGQERTTLRGSWGPVSRLAFAPDGKRLAIGVEPLHSSPQAEEQSRVLLWDERSNQLTTILSLPAPVRDLVFSPDGRILLILMARSPVCGTIFSRRILFWDTATGCEGDALEWHADSVLSAAFSPDGEWLATGGADGLVKRWPWRQLLERSGEGPLHERV